MLASRYFAVANAFKTQTHPAVVESAAVGSPDLNRGELVKAFVILSDEYRDKVLGKKDKEKELILDMQVRALLPRRFSTLGSLGLFAHRTISRR